VLIRKQLKHGEWQNVTAAVQGGEREMSQAFVSGDESSWGRGYMGVHGGVESTVQHGRWCQQVMWDSGRMISQAV
jgi:hypothetical protein